MYTRFVVVEIQDNHIEFLVEIHHFAGVVDATPGKIRNMNQAIHASQVDKNTVRSDVFHHSFQHLTFFQLADNLLFLLFDIGFDKRLVGNHHVLELLVDLHNLEFHGLPDILIVVAYRFDVDL